MKKPGILLVTRSQKVCKTFENNLNMFFGSKIQIYFHHEHHPVDPEAMDKIDLVLLSTNGLPENLPKIRESVPTLVARRTIHLPNLEQLMDLAPGTRALFVTNNQELVKDSIALLQCFGFSHLHFIPYVPSEDTPVPDKHDVDLAITLGLPELVPETIETIIDLENRPIDLTTILDVARLLHLSVEKAHFYTAEFLRDFVQLGRNLAISVNNERRLKQELASILDAVHEGIIGMDEQGRITVFNEDAEKILKLSAKNCIGKAFSEVIPDFNVQEVFRSHAEVLDQVLETRNLHLLITKIPMMLDGQFMGAVVTFQDVTKVQRVEQEIRKKSIHLGLTTKYSFHSIIGVSSAIALAKQTAMKLSKSNFTVLITGENGTGKEVFAQSIHRASLRKEGPFVPVNFAGLTESLAESELFGYEEGAFTGARKGGKMGLFELAHNGTIFLDEIGDAPLSIQASLLRVLQERQVMRIGGNRVIPINVRVIAATNRNLLDMVRKGTFREDLYYRLNVLPLHIPCLRERREDFFILIDYFLKSKNKELVFSEEARNILLHYNWPGNIRELENFINYLMVIVEDNQVRPEHIPERIVNAQAQHITGAAELAPASGIEEVKNIILVLSHHGSLADYEDILNILWMCSKRQERIGRKMLQSMMPRPLSEAQIRSKLSILSRWGCITVGVKKQGSQITPLGIQVLQSIQKKQKRLADHM